MLVDFQTIQLLWPEVMLVLMAAWIYVASAFQQSRPWWAAFAIAVYGFTGAVILWTETPEWAGQVTASVVSGPIVVDYLGYALRIVALLVGVLFTLLISQTASRNLAGEAVGSLMLLVVGVMLVARANDLVALFVGLELISVPTYVLLFLGRRDRATSEATLKYFFLSILASAIFLYGLSFLYGIAGTTILVAPSGEPSIQAALSGVSGPSALDEALTPVALVLLLAGLGFKIAAVPFHFYAPDVYQGATNTNAGLLAIAPKIAGIAAIIRLLVVAMPWAADLAWQFTVVLAAMTMTVGNVCALWQQNIRRLMAYSSIAHGGYMLIGLAVAFAFTSQPISSGLGGIGSALLYLLVYVLASLGTFAALTFLGSGDREVDGVDDLAGLGRAQPVVGAALAVFMFSLAGIPPLAGFWGKFGLFTGAISTAAAAAGTELGYWFAVLAVVGAVNAAIAAAYYLRVVSVIYFRTGAAPGGAAGGLGAWTAMAVCALLVILLGAAPRVAVIAAQRAESSVRQTIPYAQSAGTPDARSELARGGSPQSD